MKKIILDTNFLLIPSQFKVDIFEEIKRICNFKYELCIIDKTVEELNNIIKTQPQKQKMHAKLALSIIKKYKIKQINTTLETNVDSLILRTVTKNHIVATQDIELKRILKEKRIPLIYLRQKQFLELKEY
ncbi:MAG: nucleotide-binding protein [Candidatus Woesearchaeota archaeon]|jgi:hypothetical protein|nr:nucleotide-binding protein [Candidatus Woesearchaeota archaeon]MDP7457501.1 nucleotide-binding protein [Candidatus Woesearchaeota archaeon]